MPDPDQEFAETLMRARAERRCLPAAVGAEAIPDQRAYRIQERVTAIRLARGERVVGWKLGYTSRAMREQMGVADPNFGPLTDAMVLVSGATVPESVIQPKVEPEIALILGEDVREAMTAATITHCVAEARAALEVVDSIWLDYRFSWADNTADGSSAAFVVLGPSLPLDNLSAQEVVLRLNGVAVGSGSGANAMGDPYSALAWLSERVSGHERGLRAGDVIITGGLCRAEDLRPSDEVSARFGAVEVSVRRVGRGGNGTTSRGKVEP